MRLVPNDVNIEQFYPILHYSAYGRRGVRRAKPEDGLVSYYIS